MERGGKETVKTRRGDREEALERFERTLLTEESSVVTYNSLIIKRSERSGREIARRRWRGAREVAKGNQRNDSRGAKQRYGLSVYSKKQCHI